MATSRFKRGSRARYTVPMPPSPSFPRIWYGPTDAPGVNAIARDYSGSATLHQRLTATRHGYQPLESRAVLIILGLTSSVGQ